MTAPAIETPHPRERGRYTPTVASLLRAELLRVRSRRFVKGAVIGLLAVMALVASIHFAQTAKPDIGATHRPALRSDLPSELLGVGLGVAVLAFVLGCTVGGADWSQKTMTALLFWEPRRVRVFVVKLAALLISLTAILIGAVLVWTVVNALLVAVHGVADVSYGSIAGDAAGYFCRAWLLVLVMGALAYGIASLARNTGAALGVGFVYFAIVEFFVNALLPRFAQWTLSQNVGALLTDGGLQTDRDGVAHAISILHGGLVLTVYAVVVCLVGLELFRRRDVT